MRFSVSLNTLQRWTKLAIDMCAKKLRKSEKFMPAENKAFISSFIPKQDGYTKLEGLQVKTQIQ